MPTTAILPDSCLCTRCISSAKLWPSIVCSLGLWVCASTRPVCVSIQHDAAGIFVDYLYELAGVFPCIWAAIQSRCEELGGVDWEWQSADASMGKARLGGMQSVAIRPTEGSREPSAAFS